MYRKRTLDISDKTFRTPFSKEYWRLAAAEFADLRMIALAAVLIALRVALKNVVVPVGENLNVFITFPVTAVGSAVFGPLVAFVAGIVSDIIGYAVTGGALGAFHPFYTFIEAFGSFLYGLFLYRAKISVPRLVLTKFTVNFLANIILNSLASIVIYGAAAYAVFAKGLAKNIFALPFEVLALFVVFRAVLPPLSKMNYISSDRRRILPTSYAFVITASLVGMVILGAAAIWSTEIVNFLRGIFKAIM